jgi:hypothetical protein
LALLFHLGLLQQELALVAITLAEVDRELRRELLELVV